MATFDFDGEKYKRASRHQREWGNNLIALLDLAGDERICDLGCGDGVLSGRLANLVPAGEVVGIDGSPGMIETARQDPVENLSFVCLDILEMAFEARFDLLFSNAALHWVKDHRRLLHLSRQALKPGGSILWSFAGQGNCESFFAVVRRLMTSDEFAPAFRGFTWPWYMPSVEDYSDLLTQTGFKVQEVKAVNADHYFQDAQEITGWIDQPSLVPFISYLSDPEVKAAFRDRVVRDTLEESACGDGRHFEAFRRIQVQAVAAS